MATLIAVNKEHFKEVVELDVRGEASPSQADWLRKPENVEQWYWSLVALKKSIEAQLGSKKANLYATKGLTASQAKLRKQDYYAWKAKILRFKSAAEERMIEARGMRHTSWLREDVILDERNNALETITILRAAINQHQQNTREPSEEDRKLWNMI